MIYLKKWMIHWNSERNKFKSNNVYISLIFRHMYVKLYISPTLKVTLGKG